MAIQIYGMGPSRSFRAIWGAYEAGVDFEYVSVNLGSAEKDGTQSEAYKKINSQGKVPALVNGNFVLTESAAILSYLANQSSNKNLIPRDGTEQRAAYDEMCFFIVTELEQALWTKGKHSFALPKQYRVPEIIDKTTNFEFKKAHDALLILKGDRKFAAGNHFTMADVLLGQTLAWADNVKFEVSPELLA